MENLKVSKVQGKTYISQFTLAVSFNQNLIIIRVQLINIQMLRKKNNNDNKTIILN